MTREQRRRLKKRAHELRERKGPDGLYLPDPLGRRLAERRRILALLENA